MERIGLIGLGLLGSALGERLRLRMPGAAVLGWDRSAGAREAWGGVLATSGDEVFAGCSRVVLCLPSHVEVAEVLRQAHEAGALRSGAVVADCSTGAPEAALAAEAWVRERGADYLDATVSGSSRQVREGAGVFMVGGRPEVFQRCTDLLEAIGEKVFYAGPPGAGARMKLVTNLVLGLNRAALAEGLVFARMLGVDGELALKILMESAAYSRIMESKGAKMLREDFAPEARLAQHAKDVRLMLLEAKQSGAGGLPLTSVHANLLETAVRMGLGDQDNSAIIRAIAAFGTDSDTEVPS